MIVLGLLALLSCGGASRPAAEPGMPPPVAARDAGRSNDAATEPTDSHGGTATGDRGADAGPGSGGAQDDAGAWVVPPPIEGVRDVEVRTAGEFQAAIASDTRILVQPGEINLATIWAGPDPRARDFITSDGEEEPPPGTEYVRWTNPYDGWEMEIHDVTNLHIVGVGQEKPRIVTTPRYAWVLRFVDASGITLSNLSLGHTEAGYCLGGVLSFERTEDVTVRDADLSGSGTYGVGLTEAKRVVFERATIHDCTYGIAQIQGSEEVEFRDSAFRENQEFDLIEVRSSRGVRFTGCTFKRNRAGESYSMFLLEGRSRVEVRSCTFRDNAAGRRDSGSAIDFVECDFAGNEFGIPDRPPDAPQAPAGLADRG
jgi:hypothetical protein